MCKKVVVLFSDPKNPPAIRSSLRGIGTTFFSADEKKIVEKLNELRPSFVFMDGICTKIANKVLRGLSPETNTAYVGGRSEQIRELPVGTVILDNWTIAQTNLRQQLSTSN